MLQNQNGSGSWSMERTRESLLHDLNNGYNDDEYNGRQSSKQASVLPSNSQPNGQPVILSGNGIDEHEEVEETLNIVDKEKELIVKALKKHKGKRKDAASDLGISERTLYRKLKEYVINE